MAGLTKWDPRSGPLQLSTLRRLLQEEGKATAWWSDIPGTKSGERAHHWPETRWMLAGYVRVHAGDQLFDLGPGDRLDLPPDTPHTTEVVGLATAIYVTGTSDPSLIALAP